jgi:rRNA-processing protein FCF1
MTKLLLDTSFIISAVKAKLDIFDELLEHKIIIPKQVLVELEGLAKSNSDAELAQRILQANKELYTSPDLKTKNTDYGIKKYARKNPTTIIATLDRDIKKSVKNIKLIIRAKKKFEII